MNVGNKKKRIPKGKLDINSKEFMRNKKMFAYAFNYFIYDGEKVIDPNDLKNEEMRIEEKQKGIDEDRRRMAEDVILNLAQKLGVSLV